MGKASFCWLLSNIKPKIEYYFPPNIINGDIIKQVYEKGKRKEEKGKRKQENDMVRFCEFFVSSHLSRKNGTSCGKKQGIRNK